MIGAIVGDIVGSRFEWHNRKTKDFELFVTMEMANEAASREYKRQKALERERPREAETPSKWRPFGRKKQRLGALMAQSGSLLSSSIKTEPEAPKHPFARTERPCMYTDDSVMTLAVADTYYGVPTDIREKAEGFLDPFLIETLHLFEQRFA